MESLFYTMFAVCFSCFAFRTAFNALQNRESELAEERRLCTVASVAMFVLWFTWFYERVYYYAPKLVREAPRCDA